MRSGNLENHSSGGVAVHDNSNSSKCPVSEKASGLEGPSYRQQPRWSAGVAFFLRIQKFGETRIFLKEVKVLVVARVIAIGRAQVDGNFEVGERGIGFAGQTIEGRERVVNVVGFRSKLAGFFEALAGFIPAAEIHHGDTALIVLLGRFGILIVRGLHALFGDAKVSARAIGQFSAGASDDLFEFLFGALEFLLMKEAHGLFVGFHLCLNQGVNHLNTAALGWRNRYVVLFL